MCFSRKVFEEYLDSLQKNIRAKVRLQLYWNPTSACIFFYKYATCLQQNAFLENTYGELLLYIVVNIEVRKSKYGSKYVGKKLFEIHFKILTTFSNFTRDFRLVAKY